MDDSDNEVPSSRLSETSENDSVDSKGNDLIAKTSPLGPNVLKRVSVCQSPVFETSSTSTEPVSESSSEPDIPRGIWVRKSVDQVDSSVSSKFSSGEEDSQTENEESSNCSVGQISLSSIEEDLNFSINRYCNYEASEPSTNDHSGDSRDFTHDSDYTARPLESSCDVREEGRHATADQLSYS